MELCSLLYIALSFFHAKLSISRNLSLSLCNSTTHINLSITDTHLSLAYSCPFEVPGLLFLSLLDTSILLLDAYLDCLRPSGSVYSVTAGFQAFWISSCYIAAQYDV